MKVNKITDNVYCFNVDIRTTEFFEGIWPIPDGVSLNFYVVKGEKTALIDLFADWDAASEGIEKAFASIDTGFSEIDYLILNHIEPDHTGWLMKFREKNPGVEIISTKKGIDMVKSFYKIDTGVRAVKDGETLDLGNGKILTFFKIPNVHWPETMATWDASSATLFSCDAFGSYGALGEKVFDDQLDEKEHAFFEAESLRYYSNILASFSAPVERAVQKFAGLEIKCVAPSHGIVWRKDPQKIIDRYMKYASWTKGPAEKKIAVIWGSMYGNTKAGMEAVVRGIEKEGIPYTLHRVPDENVSYILAAAYRSSGLVIAMPTYENAVFPPMAYMLDIFRHKHIFGKIALRIGSAGWGGGAQREYYAILENLKWDSIDSFEWQGYPTEEEFAVLEERGRELAQRVKNS
ncbi:MAG: FprA family A-type flavoprotein [Leptospirales bacterium]|nr:FprA family A-type flavoprotein [Leptospirales bacterium]